MDRRSFITSAIAAAASAKTLMAQAQQPPGEIPVFPNFDETMAGKKSGELVYAENQPLVKDLMNQITQRAAKHTGVAMPGVPQVALSNDARAEIFMTLPALSASKRGTITLTTGFLKACGNNPEKIAAALSYAYAGMLANEFPQQLAPKFRPPRLAQYIRPQAIAAKADNIMGVMQYNPQFSDQMLDLNYDQIALRISGSPKTYVRMLADIDTHNARNHVNRPDAHADERAKLEAFVKGTEAAQPQTDTAVPPVPNTSQTMALMPESAQVYLFGPYAKPPSASKAYAFPGRAINITETKLEAGIEPLTLSERQPKLNTRPGNQR